jgi:putative inorganic carbon (HCO3(-)) transporter
MSERLAFGYGTSGYVGGRPPHDQGIQDSLQASRPAGVGTDDSRPSAPVPARRDWAFIGLMTFTAVLYFRPQDNIPGLAPLHLAELSAIAALLALVIGRLSAGKSITRFTPELGGVLALGAIILITAPFSIWMGGAIGMFTDVYVKIILIFLLMLNTLQSSRRVDKFLWLIVLASGYLAFRALFDSARGINLIENGRVQGAVSGMFGNPNDLALNMVVVIPLAVSLALRAASTIPRVGAALCAVMMLGAVVASQSRGGTVGLAVVILILGVSIARKKPGFAVAAALVLLLGVPLTPPSYWQRVSSIMDESLDSSGSRTTRREVMGESFQAFLDHPLTGVGAGQFKDYDPKNREQAWAESHNAVLQVAADLGVSGVAVFLFLVARALMAGRQARQLLGKLNVRPAGRRKAKDSAGAAAVTPAEVDWIQSHGSALLAALAGWFFCALFASVAYGWTFYYLVALAIAPREMLLDRIKARGARPAPANAATRLHEARA